MLIRGNIIPQNLEKAKKKIEKSFKKNESSYSEGIKTDKKEAAKN